MKRIAFRKPKGIGATTVLAAIFLASGLIRFGDGPASDLAHLFGTRQAGAASDLPAPEAPDSALEEILAELKDRQGELDEREARLAERETRLAAVEGKLREQLDELARAENSLTELMKLSAGAAEDDLSRLTAVYEGMEPKRAAELFAEMSPVFAAGFLGRMRPDAAAQIMAGLDPSAAYSISVIIAGRNAGIPSDG